MGIATDITGNTVEETGLGYAIGDADRICRPIAGSLRPVPWAPRPMAQLLLAESCTVTIAHSRTQNLPDVIRRADIVVAAVGRPEMVKADWIKPGATVIDVGINRVPAAEAGKTKLVGDVDYAAVAEVAAAITPVPGGVGPMTIAVLLRNTLVAAHRNAGVALEDQAL